MPGVEEFTQIITIDGTTFDLGNAGQGSKWILSQNGWGMPPVNYITHRQPQSGDERVADYRLQPRNLSLRVRHQFCSRADYWTGRAALLDVVRFNQGDSQGPVPVTLRRRLPDGSLRDLEAYIVSGPAFTPQASTEWDHWAFTEVLRFVCYNPVVSDPTVVETVWTLAGFSDLVFPITFSITFGSSLIDDVQNITYQGTWLDLPQIVITGPLQSPIITNNTTGEVVALDYNVPAGRVVTIDLAYGIKSVTDDLGTNLIGTVTAESNLGTWHLAPDPEATGGINEVRAQGTKATAATEIKIQHQNRYIGI